MTAISPRFKALFVFFLMFAVPVQALAQAESRITAISDPVVVEGNTGNTMVQFDITCQCDLAVNATVNWQLNDGSATVADNDYVDASGVINVVGGTGVEMYSVQAMVVGDFNVEPDENFSLQLTGASVGAPSFFIDDSEGTATIQNDDVLVDIAMSALDAPDPVTAGSGANNLTHTLTVMNNGPGDATNVAVTVTPTTPTGVTIESVTPSGTGSYAAGLWTVGALANTASETLTIVLTVDSSAAVGTDVISALGAVSAVDQEDSNSGNDSAGEATTVAREVDIVMTKTESIDPVVAGSGVGNLVYVVTATNNGPSDVTGASFTEALTLPAGVTVVGTPSASAGAVGGASPNYTWTGVDIPALGSATLTVTLTAASSTAVGTDTISDTATFTGSTGLETIINTGDDAVTESTSVTRSATIDVTKSYADAGAGEVNLTLTCNSVVVGTATTVGLQASFTLTDFADGTACDVTEEIPATYFPTYSADCSIADLASGTAYNCDIVNAITNASFLVTKAYSDGNSDEVDVTLTCNNGLPLQQTFTISEGSSVKFVITTFDEGEMDCEISETGTASGYTPSYDNGTVISADSCEYIDVSSAAYTCAITNAADDATFTVYKEWEVINDGGDAVNEIAVVTIYCNNPIQGGFFNGEYYLSGTLEGSSDFLTATVDTTLGSAQCRAEESLSQSGVETEDNCETRTIPAGGSSECTISNTVFFEGIPTLSQYGLAIMALLMLGVGFVGFRRMI